MLIFKREMRRPKWDPMLVHADILRACKTTEQREQIKWFHARDYLFAGDHIREQFYAHNHVTFGIGMQLAKQCDHPDARLMVSLFPKSLPRAAKNLVAVFLLDEPNSDPRRLCWASMFKRLPGEEVERKNLLMRAAEGGNVWAKVQLIMGGKFTFVSSYVSEAESADEPEALYLLGLYAKEPQYFYHHSLNDIAKKYYIAAADLGHTLAQRDYANLVQFQKPLEYFIWMKRSAIQRKRDSKTAMLELYGNVKPELQKFDQRHSTGRELFELGEFLRLNPNKSNRQKRIVAMYSVWRHDAKRGILCWLWIAKQIGVVKDLRVLIADMIWNERSIWATWSLNKPSFE